MSLDVVSIEEDIAQLARHLSAARQEEHDVVGKVVNFLSALDTADLQRAVADFQSGQEKVPWLVAFPLEPPGTKVPAPDPPGEFAVVASDGSFIPPDRHSPASYFLLNMGQATIRYGSAPDARLSSSARLYFRYDETHIQDDSGADRPIEGGLLGWKMAVEEMEYLWEHASGAARPVLAVRDGSLIFWGLQSEGKRVQEALLKPVLRAFYRFKNAGIPIASYISYPGSRDVNNALRVWLCPGDPLRCRCGSEAEERMCSLLKRVTDRVTFARLLRPGERSAVFSSSSEVLEKYGVHRIQFFYLHVGSEIARVEAPEWVMSDPAMLGFVHAVLVDQARRGDGYPPALMEAHEKAVVSVEDRRMVERLLERLMGSEGISYTRSHKDRSKRVRGT